MILPIVVVVLRMRALAGVLRTPRGVGRLLAPSTVELDAINNRVVQIRNDSIRLLPSREINESISSLMIFRIDVALDDDIRHLAISAEYLSHALFGHQSRLR